MTIQSDWLRSLRDRIAPVSAEDARRLQEALRWACDLHLGQVRKDGSALIDHVRGVTENIVELGSADPDLVIAGLLHDSAENTDTPLQAVRDRFGDRVADLVDAVTNREGEDAAASAQRAARAGRDALYLRLCDRLDGVRRSPGRKPAAREKFLAASREVHLVLAGEHFPRLAGALRQALSDAAGS